MTETTQTLETTQPNQIAYKIGESGEPVLASLSSGTTWGPGQGYPYQWDRFFTPRNEQPGTWRAFRHNWRTGGALQQLGTTGNFGPVAVAQAGWVRRRFALASGRNDLRITYRMGPVTERPDGYRARGLVYAHLVSNHPYIPNQYASSELPAGSVVTLDLTSFVPGNAFDLYVGCTTILRDPGRNPYCEVIVDDIKVHHTRSPYYGALEGGEAAQRGAELSAADVPEGVEVPELVDGMLDLENIEILSAGDAGGDDWLEADG